MSTTSAIKFMKIAIVNKHRDEALGGSELQCDFIAEELQNRGHQITYIAPGFTANIESEEYIYCLEACEFTAEGIINALNSFSPDVIYWRFNKNFFLKVAGWSRKQSIPFIFAASSVNDVSPGFYKYNLGIRNFFRSIAESYWNHLGFRYVDVLTVNNKEHLDKLNIEPQVFVQNGMKEDFEPFRWEREYCAWISNIKQIKRPEKVVELAKRLQGANIDVLMVGQLHDKNYRWLEDKVQLPSNLHYLGKRTPEEVNGILRSSRVHIHTCYPEGFPNVFIQAWIQGTPSVSLGYDPNGYIESKKMGFYSREDVKLFAKQVVTLFQHAETREKMGHNAREFARNFFSIEASVDKIEALMRRLTRQSSREEKPKSVV
jgi:glycosyltransferase involved in cell wall biosynthesis